MHILCRSPVFFDDDVDIEVGYTLILFYRIIMINLAIDLIHMTHIDSSKEGSVVELERILESTPLKTLDRDSCLENNHDRRSLNGTPKHDTFRSLSNYELRVDKETKEIISATPIFREKQSLVSSTSLATPSFHDVNSNSDVFEDANDNMCEHNDVEEVCPSPVLCVPSCQESVNNETVDTPKETPPLKTQRKVLLGMSWPLIDARLRSRNQDLSDNLSLEIVTLIYQNILFSKNHTLKTDVCMAHTAHTHSTNHLDFIFS